MHLVDTNGADLGGIDPTGSGYGALQGGFIPPTTKTLYVDGTRTDSYTADGSLLKPFKTITAAVNQIIANGDNSASVPYFIDIVGATTYNETVDLGNAAIVNLVMDGHRGAIVSPTSGDALKSTTNNTGFAQCVIQNLTFQVHGTDNALNFQCPTNNGGLGLSTLLFIDCFFNTNGGTSKCLLLNNVVNIEWHDCAFVGNSQLTNVNLASVLDGVGLSPSATPTTTLITNNGLPTPQGGFTGTILQTKNANWSGNISIDAGSTFADQFCKDIARGGTITVNGSYLSEQSIVRGNITVNSGGTYTPRGGAGIFSGTLTINSGGSLAPTGTFIMGNSILGAAAPTVQAGQVGLGSTVAATATAGAATLPANPTGFLIVNIAGTAQKIPYYNS